MFLKTFTTVFIILFSTSLFSQVDWTVQLSGSSSSLNGANTRVNVFENGIGYISSSQGKVLKTTDFGNSWYDINTGFPDNYWSLFFVNENTGWISSGHGKILKTENGGMNWTSQYSSFASLIYIDFLNENTGWAVGHYGEVLKTTNGGNVWFEQNSGTNANIFQSSFVNESTGWLSSDVGVLKTIDGGNNWYLTGYYSPFYAIKFIDENTGWISGQNSTIYKSTNGGITFFTQQVLTNFGGSVSFWVVNPDLIFTCGYNGKIFKSVNGGESWENVYSGNNANQIRSVQFVDNDGMKGFAVGYSGFIAKTTDSGSTWISSGSSPYNQRLWSSYFLNENTGFAVGNGGLILKSSNSGKDWIQKISGTSSNFIYVDFVNDHTGFVVGHGGIIKKTTNAGESWFSVNSNTASNLFQTSFVDENLGWTAGDNGISKTIDGGLNWTLSSNITPYAIKFINESTGFTCSKTGYMYKTTDAGNTWVNTQYIPNFISVSFYFVNDLTGWTVGYNNKIFKTTDGGNSWAQQVSPVPGFNQLRFVYFTDSQGLNGWIAGYGGNILRTINGGEDWFKVAVPIQVDYTNIFFVDENTGWAVGDYATIIHTTNGSSMGLTNISGTIPDKIQLFQNYPNPFNPVTKIRFGIPFNSDVRLTVFDLLGRVTKVLLEGNITAGEYEFSFSATELPSGVYFYRLETENFSDVKRMVFLK